MSGAVFKFIEIERYDVLDAHDARWNRERDRITAKPEDAPSLDLDGSNGRSMLPLFWASQDRHWIARSSAAAWSDGPNGHTKQMALELTRAPR